jgi:glutamate racemase
MAKILIFDSGVGGLSIAKGIVQKLPEAQLIFASDNEAYPYGTKTTEELIPRVSNVVDKLIAEVSPDILVVACNTASTVVLPILRTQIAIPVVGVVPAIKPAAKLSLNKHIGVLATPATIKRQYTFDLIEKFAADSEVSLLGSSELVELAEKKLHHGKVDKKQLNKIVEPWLTADNKIDTIVLACTHFPLIEKELDEAFTAYGRSIKWVDSTIGIAKRVEFLLEINNLKATASNRNNQAIFTKYLEHSECFIDVLKQIQIDVIDVIDV